MEGLLSTGPTPPSFFVSNIFLLLKEKKEKKEEEKNVYCDKVVELVGGGSVINWVYPV